LAGKSFEIEIPVSSGRVFRAAARMASELGYAVQHSDPNAGALSFNTGASMWARLRGRDPRSPGGESRA
jgi:hypothetical protein